MLRWGICTTPTPAQHTSELLRSAADNHVLGRQPQHSRFMLSRCELMVSGCGHGDSALSSTNVSLALPGGLGWALNWTGQPTCILCHAAQAGTFGEGHCGKEGGEVVASANNAARHDPSAVCCSSDAWVHDAVAKHRHIPAHASPSLDRAGKE